MKKFGVFLSLCFLFLFSQMALAQTEVDDLPPPQIMPKAEGSAPIASPTENQEPMQAPVQPQMAPTKTIPPAPNFNQAPASVQKKEKAGPVIVGRVNEISGGLQRYVEEKNEWVPTEINTPFGIRDSLASEPNSKTEFVFPNNTIIRIGENTQLKLTKLDNEVTEVAAGSGVIRFANNGEGIIRCATDYGFVQADAGTAFDIIIAESAVEVFAVKGQVQFVAGEKHHTVIEGQPSLLADQTEVTAGNGNRDQGWIAWNGQRDDILSGRIAKATRSVKYLHKGLQPYAADLEENGTWRKVMIEGANRVVWQPNVVAGWQPFVNGQWVDYYGDQVFVSNDSFGYVTHHYGNWIYNDESNAWLWAPPCVGAVVVGGPYLPIEYAYYPGRVSWMVTEGVVGWVPLAYTEPYCPVYWGGYYGYYGYPDYWGPRYGYGYYGHHHDDYYFHDLRYGRDHAFYVNHHDFYGHHEHGYHDVSFRGDHSRFNGIHASHHMDGRSFGGGHERFHASGRTSNFQPDKSVHERIGKNQFAGRPNKGDNVKGMRDHVRNTKPGNFSDKPARSIHDQKGGGQHQQQHVQPQHQQGQQNHQHDQHQQNQHNQNHQQNVQPQHQQNQHEQHQQQHVQPQHQQQHQQQHVQPQHQQQHQQQHVQPQHQQGQHQQQHVQPQHQQQHQQHAQPQQQQQNGKHHNN